MIAFDKIIIHFHNIFVIIILIVFRFVNAKSLTFYNFIIFSTTFIVVFMLFINFISKKFFLLLLNFFFIEFIFRIFMILSVLK